MDKGKVLGALEEQLSHCLVFPITFSNMLDLVMGVVWVSTMKSIEEMIEEVREMGVFKQVVPNIIYYGYHFRTWKDRLEEKDVRQS